MPLRQQADGRWAKLTKQLKLTRTYTYMHRILLFIFFLAGQFSNAQTSNSSSTVWKHVTKDINIGFRVSFDYPSYWKFDWVENCLCLGKPSKAPQYIEYNNTMNWGIWMEDGENYQLPTIDFYKDKFHGDIYETEDTVTVAGYKATRLTYKQRKGTLFMQNIIFRIGGDVFDIENNKGDTADFQTFLKSINIKKI